MIGITSWGSVCALGLSTAASVEALRAGKTGLSIPRYSPHLIATDGAFSGLGEVPLEGPLSQRPRRLLELAVSEALSSLPPSSGKTGIFVGTTGGFFANAELELFLERQKEPDAMPSFARRGQGEVAESLIPFCGSVGPVLTWSMACTSSAAALVAAGRHLQAGHCDRALVVGYELLSSMTIHGFRGLMLTDAQGCRPFDRDRAGLQLGEGCGVLVLEPREAPFLLLGSSNCIDTSNLTASSTDGSTVERVMRQALSGADPGRVVAIKAHGTGTRDNDLAEGRGISRLFGENPPPFLSIKGAIGHSLGAAAVLETALYLGCLSAGFLPVSAGFSEVDPEIGLGPNRRLQPAPPGHHLLNAFGFGGSCISTVISHA